MLRFAEEILLLLHNDDRGDFAPGLAPDTLNIVLAGAVLMDLALENRIDTDLDHLFLANPTPLEDDLLDPILADIVQDTDMRDARYWVTQTAKRGDEIRDKALARLVNRGILEPESEGIFFLSRLVSRSRRYPTIDGEKVEEVRLRIMRVLFTDEIPDPRDIVIICLADACGVFQNILSRSELSEVQGRIELIRKMDLIGQSVNKAIRNLDPPPSLSTTARHTKAIPQAPALPIIGNAIPLMRDMRSFLIKQYRNLGPIFRIKAFNRHFTVLIGPEANTFVKQGKHYFSNREGWQGFNADLGVSRIVISMEGPEHIRMRKAQANVYTHKLIENRLAETIDIVRRDIAQWPLDTPMPAQYICQRIVTEQLLVLATSTSVKDYFDDIIIFFRAMMMRYLVQRHPKFMLYRPRVRRARKRVLELSRKILADHHPENRHNTPPDYIDELLELNRTDPYFMPEKDLLISAMGPMFVGLDTMASTCAFMLYALLKYPDLYEQTVAEINPLFDQGTPDLRNLRRLDVTHRIAMEAMRLWPPGPAFRRTVVNSFEFEGYTVPVGEEVLVGFTVPHYLPEYFPDPERFDIDRYTPQRAEHRQRGVYAPFSLGAHQCLGRSLAEALLVINLGTIIRGTKLVLDPPSYELKIRTLPAAHPDPSFRVRLMQRHQ